MFHKKGQIFSIDMIFAIIVFCSILMIFLMVKGGLEQNIAREKTYAKTNEAALSSFRYLVETKGSPENWYELNLSNVSSIGLQETDGKLSIEKINRMVNLSILEQQKVKEILGIEPYDFSFKIGELNGTTINETMANTSKKQVIVLHSIENLNGSAVLFEWKIYSEGISNG